jgi:repressor LexA
MTRTSYSELQRRIAECDGYAIDVQCPKDLKDRYPDCFFIEVEGESMNKTIPHGSFVLLTPTAKVCSGDIVAFRINNELLLKRYFRYGNQLIFNPESTRTYKTIVVRDTDTRVSIVAKGIWVSFSDGTSKYL